MAVLRRNWPISVWKPALAAFNRFSPSSIARLLRPLLTSPSASSHPFERASPACGTPSETSPGNAQSPSRLCPPHLRPRVTVQVPDFESHGPLVPRVRLICSFCSSDQRFAIGFLQIPSRDGHPCRSASSSPCRACIGLSPTSDRALPGAPLKKEPCTWAWLPA